MRFLNEESLTKTEILITLGIGFCVGVATVIYLGILMGGFSTTTFLIGLLASAFTLLFDAGDVISTSNDGDF